MGATNGSPPCPPSGEHCSHPPVEPKTVVELPPPTINENYNDTDASTINPENGRKTHLVLVRRALLPVGASHPPVELSPNQL